MTHKPQRKLVAWFGAAITALGLGAANCAYATLIQVSSQSDSTVLGTVDSFSTTLSIADFYQYGTPLAASYNGNLNGGPEALSNTMQMFFVDASDGLHFVVVFDRPNDGTGASATMTTVLAGGAGGAAGYQVTDDPGDATSVTDVGADRVFNFDFATFPCCTDGFAIGALGSGDSLVASLGSISGISFFQASGASLGNIALAPQIMGSGIAFSVVDVPEPSTLALFGLGLLGLGFARRRDCSVL